MDRQKANNDPAEVRLKPDATYFNPWSGQKPDATYPQPDATYCPTRA